MNFPLSSIVFLFLVQSLLVDSVKSKILMSPWSGKMDASKLIWFWPLKGQEQQSEQESSYYDDEEDDYESGEGKHSANEVHDFEPSLNELEHLMHGDAGDVHKDNDKPHPEERHLMEPSLDGLEHLMHDEAGDVHKENKQPPKPEEHHLMEPSLDGLEHLMHGDAGDVHKDEGKPTPEENHLMEPSLDGLEKMMHDNAENVHDDEHHHNTTTEAQEKRPILPGYEGFHGLMVHGDEAFHHNGNDHDHGHEGHEVVNGTYEKPADMDAFKKWMQEQEKVTKLERFKKLHKEVSELEKPKKKHEGDFEFRLPDEVINKIGEKELKAARDRLARTIKKLEDAERRQRNKAEL